MKIQYIIEGFWNLLKQQIGIVPKKQKDLYQKRLNICLECKFLNKNYCSICGCYIKAKTKVNYDLDKKGKSIDGCPRKYW